MFDVSVAAAVLGGAVAVALAAAEALPAVASVSIHFCCSSIRAYWIALVFMLMHRQCSVTMRV